MQWGGSALPYLAGDPRFLEGTLYCGSVQQPLSFGPPPKAPPPAPALPRGVVHLPQFLLASEVTALIHAVDSVTALQPFHIALVNNPFNGDKAFTTLYLAYAGSFWHGVRKTYTPCGRSIPAEVLGLARRAIERASAEHPGVFPDLPSEADWASPNTSFTCLFNYYPPQWGAISEHSDTSEPSLAEGKTFPVVSFSIGSAVDFSLGEGGAKTSLRLSSGDVLLFGGSARNIRHGIAGVCAAGARPTGLRMVAGRLNITLRRL